MDEQKNNVVSVRKDYISWNQYFMRLAELSAQRSKDPVTQVGACIVDDNHRIVSVGYNGFPDGCNDNLFPWGKDKEDYYNDKRAYVVHAELNAILNARASVHGTTIYVTLFPCNECAKAIIQSGIRKIVYKEISDKDRADTKASIRMLEAANIIFTKYEDK